jgi:hypothetical protein
MSLNRKSLESLVLVSGILVFLLFLLIPQPERPVTYWSTLSEASRTLKGQGAPSDLTQDIVGFRALLNRKDPYPMLALGVKELGLEWGVDHASTHPPMAFLLVAPIAFLPWIWASTVWAWLMVVLLLLSFRCCGLSWKASLGLTPFALLWPPVALSLGQITIIWLSGVAVAYRFLGRRSLPSGIAVAFASFTKFFPGLMVLAFMVKRQWRAVLGFVFFWVIILVFLELMDPDAILKYVQANQSITPEQIARPDNSSLLVNSYRFGGWVGVLFVLGFFILILWTNLGRLRAADPLSSSTLWILLSYYSVALLPLFWIFTLTPLLPVIGRLVSRKKLSTMLIGCMCFAIPVATPPFEPSAVIPLLTVNVLIGIGLIVDALPYRLFTAATFHEMVAPTRATSKTH